MTGRLAAWHFAGRGWISAGLFLALAAARALSETDLSPGWLLLVGAGMAGRLAAGRSIRSHSNGNAMSEGPLALGGAYAFSRHPLYLSNLAVAAGLILFAGCLPPWAAAALFAATAAHYGLLAVSEERHLLRAAGESYARYLGATPRWLGLPKRGAAAGAAPASWAVSLGRQAGNLGKALACVLLLWGLAGLHG